MSTDFLEPLISSLRYQEHYICFLTLHRYASISSTKFASWWELIQVNFDPVQEIEPEIGDEFLFEGGHSFARLQY